MESPCRSQHLLSSGSYAHIFGEVLPAHNARVIDEEFRRTGDVLPIGTTSRMQKTIATYRLSLRIGEKCKGKSSFASQIGGDGRRVDADRHRHDALRLKLRQPILNASQLEDAEGSPVSAIKDQQHSLRLSTYG